MAQGSFAVAGIDDLRSGYSDLTGALQGLDSTIPTILFRIGRRFPLWPSFTVSHSPYRAIITKARSSLACRVWISA